MSSVCFIVNEQINDYVGLVACCPSFYSFEKSNIDIMQHILLFQINCFYLWSRYSGDTETDSDSFVDSHDNGSYLRYDNNYPDNNKYLQELGIDNSVNKNNVSNVNQGDKHITKKKKKTEACFFLFNKDWSLFCASCRGIFLRILSANLHLIKRKKGESSCFSG